MTTANAPRHDGRPPKPSIFPTLALVLLGGGAFAANVRWDANDPLWAAPLACVAGLAGCLLAFHLGAVVLGSRRPGFLGALALVALAAPLWRVPPFELKHLALLLLVPASLATGWALAGFRERRFGRGGDLLARAMLVIFGVLLSLAPLRIFPGAPLDALSASGVRLATMACFALAGLVVAGMALAGGLDRWPTPEAALVLAVGFIIWTGRLSAI